MGHGKRKKSSSNDLIALPVSSPLIRSTPHQSSPVGSTYQQRLEQLMLRAAANSSPGTGQGTSQSVVPHGSPSAVDVADVRTRSQLQQPVLVSQAASTPDGISEDGGKGNSRFFSPRPSPLGKSPRQGGGEVERGNNTYLPPPRAIPRGHEPLRRIYNHDSPVQRSLGTAAISSKIEYQAKIATWAATRVPSLGALYGLRLMSTCRSSGISFPLVNSQCERCCIVLVPGVNCSVKDSRQKRKKKRRRTNTKDGQAAEIGSTVVHVCLYCKHENEKSVSSSKQHGKTRLAQAASPAVVTTPIKGEIEASANSADPSSSSPLTPTAAMGSGTPGASIASVGQVPQSSGKKRKRKGWTSLKAVATSLLARGQGSGNQSSSSSTPSSVLGTRTFPEDFMKLSDSGGRSQESIFPVTPASISTTGKTKKHRRPSELKDMSMSSLKFE